MVLQRLQRGFSILYMRELKEYKIYPKMVVNVIRLLGILSIFHKIFSMAGHGSGKYTQM